MNFSQEFDCPFATLDAVFYEALPTTAGFSFERVVLTAGSVEYRLFLLHCGEIGRITIRQGVRTCWVDFRYPREPEKREWSDDDKARLAHCSTRDERIQTIIEIDKERQEEAKRKHNELKTAFEYVLGVLERRLNNVDMPLGARPVEPEQAIAPKPELAAAAGTKAAPVTVREVTPVRQMRYRELFIDCHPPDLVQFLRQQTPSGFCWDFCPTRSVRYAVPYTREEVIYEVSRLLRDEGRVLLEAVVGATDEEGKPQLVALAAEVVPYGQTRTQLRLLFAEDYQSLVKVLVARILACWQALELKLPPVTGQPEPPPEPAQAAVPSERRNKALRVPDFDRRKAIWEAIAPTWHRYHSYAKCRQLLKDKLPEKLYRGKRGPGISDKTLRSIIEQGLRGEFKDPLPLP